MSNKTIEELVKLQDSERQDFASGVNMAWQPVKKNEQALLAPYNNDYEKAPKAIQKQIDRQRENFYAEWGSKGRLATLMDERHKKERETLVIQKNLLDTLEKKRSQDHDKGR